MVEPVIRPATISYTGLYADQHLVDAQELGRSLVGVSRMANGILHLYLNGQVARSSRSFEIRYFAGPPKQNGLLIEFFALMANSQFPTYPPIFTSLADVIVPQLWNAVIARVIGRNADMGKALDVINEQARQHHELAIAMQQGQMHDKAWLQDAVDKLIEFNRQPLREIPAPVGSSCAEETILGKSVAPVVIDEAAAEALKSKEELVVGDATTYEGVFESLDLTNGLCKFQIGGENGEILRGKITDPSLSVPENVYARTLSSQKAVVVTAKPVMKEGDVNRLYISDARER